MFLFLNKYYNSASIFSLLYDFLKVFFSLGYFFVRIQYITHITLKCVTPLLMFGKALVSSGLFVVKTG